MQQGSKSQMAGCITAGHLQAGWGVFPKLYAVSFKTDEQARVRHFSSMFPTPIKCILL